MVSEPKTANVTWLLDQIPSVTHFIDVHFFGELILDNWGDDDQTTDPSMNIHNPTTTASAAFRTALPVRTRTSSGSTCRLPIWARRPSGHRHARRHPDGTRPDVHRKERRRAPTDSTTGMVLGYTIEWGPRRKSIPRSFHPGCSDMVPIIEEITAALLAFCSAVASRIGELQQNDHAAAVPGQRSPANKVAHIASGRGQPQ
ncbi:hypothetical protein [Modestobacter marinus]|uniref:hypothetical protein n=1 Tax=Modestobacter marinus TaxID=477641 RepID=UPI001C94A600|nr:hypothetical protein [Modestobacter marinus]